MELTAKPRDNASSSFVKFEKIGDSVRGLFVKYGVVDGNFGPKKELELRTKEGMKTITCSAHLAQILDDNLEALRGMVLTITMIGTKATGKPQPMKVFKVDAAEPSRANATKPAAKPVVEADENDAAEEDPPF